MAETNRRCPFCGSVGEVEHHLDALGREEYRIRCKNCGAAMGQWWETKAQAAKWWNHGLLPRRMLQQRGFSDWE